MAVVRSPWRARRRAPPPDDGTRDNHKVYISHMHPDTPPTPATPEFEQAMLAQLEAVMRYARALTRDKSDADDLTQETFLSAFRAWRTFDATSSPRRWLFAICRHSFLRRQQRESRIVSVDEDMELDALAAVALHKSARDEGLERMFDRIDLGPAVQRALAALSDAHRIIVVVVDIEGLGYADAAESLGLPVGTVRSRLFRARRLLQLSLIEFARDAGFAVPMSADAANPPADIHAPHRTNEMTTITPMSATPARAPTQVPTPLPKASVLQSQSTAQTSSSELAT